jgi:UV DNA damage endonuclease
MIHVRLGYACVNLTLGLEGVTSRTCRLQNATPLHLKELALANLAGLHKVLNWNLSHDIMVFRISSGIIPLASHLKARWPWRQELERQISTLGDFAKEHSMRLSMHPGQYTVLNSTRTDVAAAAAAELSYHADFLDAMGLAMEHKIILHIGGVYGDRQMSLRRFSENFRSLPENVKNRLVIENDEHNYEVEDVLDLCDSLSIPMAFDYLHYRAGSKRPLKEGLIDQVCGTWSQSDGPPEMHYSTQRRRSRIGAHADMINPRDFKRFLKILPKCDIDVILEAKGKDMALLKLQKDLHFVTGILKITAEGDIVVAK